MSPFVSIHRVAILLACFAGLAAPTLAKPKNWQQAKAEIDRKAAAEKRKFEHKQREMKAKQPVTTADSAKPRGPKTGLLEAPPFDAASAPPPDQVFRAFVTAAKSASSMEPVLPYLPEKQQQALQDDQARYDPKQAAKNRQWHREQNPSLSEEQLAHLSSPPFTTALKWHKSMASSIIDVLSVKIDGNKAKLVVSTNRGVTINGHHHGNSKADVEMVGEGRTWKLAGFTSSIVVYDELPLH